MLDAIQFCVELDIPLKQFNLFTNEDEPWICYKELVAQRTGIAEEKIRVMKERLTLLKAMQAEMERSETSYRNKAPTKLSLPERTCWLTPYEGMLSSDESNELMKKLIMEIYRHDLKLGNANGLLLLKRGGEWKQFLFVDVDTAGTKALEQPEILHIPAGGYLCKTVEQSSIRRVWDWCLSELAEEQIELVIETELFVGNYAFSKPTLEQRCHLKQ